MPKSLRKKVHSSSTSCNKSFKCQGFGDCRMEFTRQEHLARHIRKHTGEQPFQCHLCLRFFSRLDNLKQHVESVHSVSMATSQLKNSKSTAPCCPGTGTGTSSSTTASPPTPEVLAESSNCSSACNDNPCSSHSIEGLQQPLPAKPASGVFQPFLDVKSTNSNPHLSPLSTASSFSASGYRSASLPLLQFNLSQYLPMMQGIPQGFPQVYSHAMGPNMTASVPAAAAAAAAAPPPPVLSSHMYASSFYYASPVRPVRNCNYGLRTLSSTPVSLAPVPAPTTCGNSSYSLPHPSISYPTSRAQLISTIDSEAHQTSLRKVSTPKKLSLEHILS